jgi:prevent-host-death family protein
VSDGVSVEAEHGEALARGRQGEALVERDERKRSRLAVGGDPCGGELECVGRAEVVNADQTPRVVPHGVRRWDFRPSSGEVVQSCVRPAHTRGLRPAALLDRVKAGETITITDRGVPVAQLAPLSGTDWDARLASLERRGLIRRPSGALAFHVPDVA